MNETRKGKHEQRIQTISHPQDMTYGEHRHAARHSPGNRTWLYIVSLSTQHSDRTPLSSMMTQVWPRYHSIYKPKVHSIHNPERLPMLPMLLTTILKHTSRHHDASITSHQLAFLTPGISPFNACTLNINYSKSAHHLISHVPP